MAAKLDIDWESLRGRLGSEPAAGIAAELGCSEGAVSHALDRLKIEPYRKRPQESGLTPAQLSRLLRRLDKALAQGRQTADGRRNPRSVRSLAAACGVGARTVVRWAAREVEPKPDQVARLACVLDGLR